MKAKKWLAVALAAVLAFALVGCGGTDKDTSAGELTGSINVEGSDTIVAMGQAWAEKFQEENPGVMISIKGGGSGTGIAALINGTVDFANASRSMKDEEKAELENAGTPAEEFQVAIDGIAVILNPANKVTALSMDQLGQIYRGEVTNWKDVGGADAEIVLLSRDSSSGTYEYFKEEVVGEDAEYAKSAKLLPSNQAIVDETKSNPNAIGYVGLGYADQAGSAIKIAEIDGTAASIESAADGSYVLSRGLYMYSAGEPSEVMQAYLDWILGPEGQAIVADQGFVPVTQ